MLSEENCRPVSILAALSKVFEKVHKLMISYFNDIIKILVWFSQDIWLSINPPAHGENWKFAIEARELVGTFVIALSKACDSLPYWIMIAKLAAYGIFSSACKLIAHYLHNRKQCVKTQYKRNAWSDVVKGVPQGSSLGPLLFNIFINGIFPLDLPWSNCNYADDNCISYSLNSVDDIKSVLNDEISLIPWKQILINSSQCLWAPMPRRQWSSDWS